MTQIEGDKTITSTASAIDLAGSEDNRRTENGKERLVESSAINKSLFVLAQCVEAISKKQARIPYRESKMTRVLALGQNNGLTLMILNLAPVRSYHLDTLSSLQFANRTKKIEIREVENEPIFRGKQEQMSAMTEKPAYRQPLRPLTAAPINVVVKSTTTTIKDKPLKAFSVYSEKVAPSRPSYGRKRASDENIPKSNRPTKQLRTSGEHNGRTIQPPKSATSNNISRADLESIVNRMVEEKLAERTIDTIPTQVAPLDIEVQRRLEALEQRIQSQAQDDERTEGLQYLYMAKQHQARGETASALKMYELAEPFFPGNEKLMGRMRRLRALLEDAHEEGREGIQQKVPRPRARSSYRDDDNDDDDDDNAIKEQQQFQSEPRPYLNEDNDISHDDNDASDADYTNTSIPAEDDDDDDHYQSDSSFHFKPKKSKFKCKKHTTHRNAADSPPPHTPSTPRTTTLLRIINTRSISQIKSLKGVGAKKAESIVNCLLEMGGEEIADLVMLARLKGVGAKTVEKMREGVVVADGDGGDEGVRDDENVGDWGRQLRELGVVVAV